MKRVLQLFFPAFCLLTCCKKDNGSGNDAPAYRSYASMRYIASVGTGDNNVLILGADSRTFYFLKITQSGNLLWKKPVEGSGVWTSLAQAGEKETLVCGYLSAEPYNIALFKVNEAGETIWSRTYENPEKRSFAGAIAAGDGGYILYGHTFGDEEMDISLMKVKNDGSVGWSKTYHLPNQQTASHLLRTSDGAFLLSAGNYTQEYRNMGVKLMKISASGSLLWEKTISSTSKENWKIFSATEGSDKSVILCGSNKTAAAVLKTDANGNEIWRNTYALDSIDVSAATAIINNPDNSFTLTGYNTSYKTGDTWNTCLVLKLDHSGNQIYRKHLISDKGFSGCNILRATNGDHLITGDDYDLIKHNNGSTAIFFTRIDMQGNYR